MDTGTRHGAKDVQHVFIVGAKSIGQYGGYETFVDRLTEQHRDARQLQYHIACKANGDGSMDETLLHGITYLESGDEPAATREFVYHNAHVFKLSMPDIGPAVAIYYDLKALDFGLAYCERHAIAHPVFYVLACRIGPFVGRYARRIHQLGGVLYVNPDGHEWKRAKWSAPIRAYWKRSERGMVKHADLVVCDSLSIQRYIEDEYRNLSPATTFIAYGADVAPSTLADDDARFTGWLAEHGLEPGGYYLVVGRFVPENNIRTILREFMASHTTRNLALVTNAGGSFLERLERELHFSQDERIRFTGTLYDAELLKKVREGAYAYLHGHEVGGTNPSLLEALATTDVNLLLNVGFNREVGQDAALYWGKDAGDLARLVDVADELSADARRTLGERARARIRQAYSWEHIGNEYERLWMPTRSQ